MNTKSKGFTLIEVMVALLVVGLALPAMVGQVQSILGYTSDIETKTYAYWIAENKMQEILLEKRLQKKVPKGRQNDSIDYGDREWYWQVEAKTTAVEKMYRLEVRVGLERDEWLATISGFIHE